MDHTSALDIRSTTFSTYVSPMDEEVRFVSRLVSQVREAGICPDAIPIINLYVALKSKPMAILAGPAASGKLALIHCLSRALLGGDCLQCQMMAGHPWWANNSDNLATLTDLHTRFIIEKLFAVLEEASQPENRYKVFIVCLAHITPAELLSYFSEVAYQLQSGYLMRIGDMHLSAPIPFPPNLFLIATMDTPSFRWWDSDLMSGATVINWSTGKTCIPALTSWPSSERRFLLSSVRDLQSAYRKFHSLAGMNKQPANALLQAEAALREYNVPLPGSVMDDVVKYLANAWSSSGQGLFDSRPSRNLAIALDLAIAQILLPHAAGHLSASSEVVKPLQQILDVGFPYSAEFLEAGGFS